MTSEKWIVDKTIEKHPNLKVGGIGISTEDGLLIVIVRFSENPRATREIAITRANEIVEAHNVQVQP